jgi:hypothetical protein
MFGKQEKNIVKVLLKYRLYWVIMFGKQEVNIVEHKITNHYEPQFNGMN